MQTLKFHHKLLRLFLLLSLLNSHQPGFSQQQKYQGRFWKISMEGQPDSYLYGTMHVSDKIAFNLTDSFYIALRSVKTVGLESDPSEWLDSFNTFENAFSYFGEAKYHTRASRGYYQSNTVFRRADNGDIAQWLKTKSGILNAMLYRENARDKEYQEDTWLEMHIYQCAAGNGIPVVSLEGFSESRELVNRAVFEESRNLNRRIVPKWMEDLIKEKGRFDLIEDAYRKGDLDMIDTLNRVFNSPGYYQYMLTERNVNQVDRFLHHHKEGPVFMAVGAAHLPGRDGVIELLRAKGFQVTPIHDERTDYAKLQKTGLDSVLVDVQYVPQRAPNGTFTMAWPTKLHASTSGYTNTTLGYDLGNGVYFQNEQLNTYAPFYGLTPEMLLAKVDSLLFENIPGEIKSKQRIETNGIPGIEIKNVSRSGDHERYRIYATPFQLQLFKLSGRKDRIGRLGDSIFGSLKLSEPDKTWETFHFVSGQFSINLPSYQAVNIIDPLQTMYATPYIQAYDASDRSYYLVKRISLHDMNYLEEDDFEVRRFAKKFMEKMKFEPVSLTSGNHLGYPAADFTAKTGHHTFVHGRFVVQGPFYYLLFCTNERKKKSGKILQYPPF